MSITLNIWTGSVDTRIYFNGADGKAIGHFGRKLAGLYSRDANTFENTVPADLFEKVTAFVVPSYFGREVTRDDENVFFALVAHCANEVPGGNNAKQRKIKIAAQKARVAAFAKIFS